MGGVYLSTENNEDIVELTASHALTDRKGSFRKIKRGEGIIGQGLNETSPVFYSDLKEEAPVLNYAVAERIPPYFVVSPLIFEGKHLGVFFVASMAPFQEKDRDFLSENLSNVSIQFNTARTWAIIRALLENAQEQSEELKVINEELEEQTRALKVSEEELQAQQEELRVTNEELEERTQALENQTLSITNKNQELTLGQIEFE
jgi:tubulin-specific chaperone A